MPLLPSPLGLHRVLDPPGVLPQAAWRLDATPEIAADEVLLRVDRMNLDAASYRQLREAHGGDHGKIRAAVLDIVTTRGKMQNPVTGSGGMLTGTVERAGPDSPLGLTPGQRVATLVSLTLTPLTITDGLARWDGQSEQVPCAGWAILFARSIAAVLPDDLSPQLALAVLDVCGAPALTQRVVTETIERASASGRGGLPSRRGGKPVVAPSRPSAAAGGPGQFNTARPWRGGKQSAEEITVLVLGAAGKSGSLSAAAAREAGAAKVIGVVPTEAEAALLRSGPLINEVVVADARDPVGLAQSVGEQADVTVVCVDVPGCEGGAILATKQGGTVIFFSMATSFPAAALTAEGMAADVTMLIGNGYVPGHAELALDLIRRNPAVRTLFERRINT
jgi:L-erythro-3,5-diaminohexanoate dehydrogenase